MKILYILRHNPWGIGGGCYASKCYLDAFTTAFAESEFDICICEEYAADETKFRDYPNAAFIQVPQRGIKEKAMTLFTGLLHRFDGTARTLLKKNVYNLCIFDHNSIAGPLATLCQSKGVKSIVINHNCEAEYYRDNYPGFLHRNILLQHVRSAEKESYLSCDYNIFLTEEDREVFRDLYGNSQTTSLVLGCFNPKDRERDIPKKSHTEEARQGKENLKLVISGTIGNVQNLDGIHYFLDELMETVPKDMEVIITGKNPPASLYEKIERSNQRGDSAKITLIPNPKDIMRIVRECDIFICPTRLGGGIKLRVMDGLKAGLPVIAHKVSARGYSLFRDKKELWAFENKEDFKKGLYEITERIERQELTKEQIQNDAAAQFSFGKKVELIQSVFSER